MLLQKQCNKLRKPYWENFCTTGFESESTGEEGIGNKLHI